MTSSWFYAISDAYVVLDEDGAPRTFSSIQDALAMFDNDVEYEKSLDCGSDGIWRMKDSAPHATNDTMVWSRRSGSLVVDGTGRAAFHVAPRRS